MRRHSNNTGSRHNQSVPISKPMWSWWEWETHQWQLACKPQLPHNLDFSMPNTLICTITSSHNQVPNTAASNVGGFLLLLFSLADGTPSRYCEGCHDFPTCCVGRYWQRFGTGSCGRSTQWPHLCGALCSPTMGHWILHPDDENLYHGRVPWL